MQRHSVPGHALPDLRVGRVRVAIEQRLRGQDLPVLAEAALRHLLVDPGLLHRVQLAVLRQPFERGDLGALHRGHRPDARPHRLALDEHRAGAALAEAAAEARALQAEVVAQDVEQRRRRVDVHGCALPFTFSVMLLIARQSRCRVAGNQVASDSP